jgi:hypothetical protein
MVADRVCGFASRPSKNPRISPALRASAISSKDKMAAAQIASHSEPARRFAVSKRIGGFAPDSNTRAVSCYDFLLNKVCVLQPTGGVPQAIRLKLMQDAKKVGFGFWRDYSAAMQILELSSAAAMIRQVR